MKNKIYVVISYQDEYDFNSKKIEMAFSTAEKAEQYMKDLIDREQGYRDAAEKCRNCAGLDKDCPFYMIPFDSTEECENYSPWHDNVEYRREEIEYEE